MRGQTIIALIISVSEFSVDHANLLCLVADRRELVRKDVCSLGVENYGKRLQFTVKVNFLPFHTSMYSLKANKT